MNAKSRSIKSLPTAASLALTAAVVILASWPYLKVHAIQDSEDFPSPFGLAQGQTARLTVLNIGDDQGFVNWKFLDTFGRTLAETPEPHLIPPGQFRSFDFDLPNPPPGIADVFGRAQVRVIVRTVGNPDIKILRSSVEVFDNATGRTSFVIPPVDRETHE